MFLSKEIFTDMLNMGLPLQAWIEKIIPEVETHQLFV